MYYHHHAYHKYCEVVLKSSLADDHSGFFKEKTGLFSSEGTLDYFLFYFIVKGYFSLKNILGRNPVV